MSRRFLRSSALFSALALGAPAVAAQPAIDGDLTDWAPGVSVSSDADDIRIRFRLPAAHTLQSAPVTVALRIDMDATNTTGQVFGDATGVDLSVLFSPPYRDGVGNGVEVIVDAEEGPVKASPAQVGMVLAPSYAAEEFEVRFARQGSLPWNESFNYVDAGRLRWWLTTQDLSGNILETWDSGEGDIVAAGGLELSDATLPEPPADGVRVGSLNVLWASPFAHPEPFIRVLNAVNADIWLFQEWDLRERDQPRIPLTDIEEWLEASLTPASDWTVIGGDQRGVLVASRLPLEPTGPVEIKANVVGDRRAMIERSVRYVSAVADTRVGKVLLGCVHLKCCGGRGDESDRQRLAESVAVSEAMHQALDRTDADVVVLGGDFNLVGSPMPLAIIRNGLDPTGIDLEPAEAMVLGDDARYTWTEDGSRFHAGRLDYILTSPSSVTVAGSWTLDTARLSDAALSAMGLLRSDSAASDHRPVIVDLITHR